MEWAAYPATNASSSKSSEPSDGEWLILFACRYASPPLASSEIWATAPFFRRLSQRKNTSLARLNSKPKVCSRRVIQADVSAINAASPRAHGLESPRKLANKAVRSADVSCTDTKTL